MEIIAVYFDSHIENLDTFNEQSAKFLIVKPCGVCRQPYTLSGHCI